MLIENFFVKMGLVEESGIHVMFVPIDSIRIEPFFYVFYLSFLVKHAL